MPIGDVIHSNPALKTYSVMKTADHDPRFSKERMKRVLDAIDREEIKYYNYLQREIKSPINDKYKENFLIYYRIPMREKKYEEIFFKHLEENISEEKMDHKDFFENVLTILHRKISPNSYPPLFLCSALIHTINPELPLWDKNILNYFKIPAFVEIPKPSLFLQKYVNAYELLIHKSEKEIKEDWFKTWDTLFNAKFPPSEYDFTNIKKLDLFFWKEKNIPYQSIKQETILQKYDACLFTKNDEYIKYIMERALVDKILMLLCEGIAAYVKSIMTPEEIYHFISENEEDFPYLSDKKRNVDDWDLKPLLEIITKHYPNKLNYEIKKTLTYYRNDWAHRNILFESDINRMFKFAHKLLIVIEAQKQVDEIVRMMNEYKMLTTK